MSSELELRIAETLDQYEYRYLRASEVVRVMTAAVLSALGISEKQAEQGVDVGRAVRLLREVGKGYSTKRNVGAIREALRALGEEA